MTVFGAGRGGITRVRTAGSAPWTPANITGIAHWYHAVNSPKTGSPGAISQLNDLIGTLHLTQADSTRQPIDNTRTINGKAALDFDGTDSLSVATGPSVALNGTMYVAMAVKVDTLTLGDTLFFSGAGTAADDGAWLKMDLVTGSNCELKLDYSNGTTLAAYNPTSPQLGNSAQQFVECWIVGTTGGVGLAIDGVDATPVTNSVGFGSPDRLDLMARSGTLNNTDGAFLEAIICTAVPSSSDRALLLAYMQDEWGTP